MMQNKLSDDDYAIILLCTSIALPNQSTYRPLSISDWNRVNAKIAASRLQTPGGLLRASKEEITKEFPARANHILTVIKERGKLAIILENLSNKGIQAVTSSNPDYPARLKKLLGEKAPPVFFYSGDLSLLNRDGVAFVGSRDADEQALQFTSMLACRCAKEGLSVISGAARGVDQAAMISSLENGGISIGFVADSLDVMIRKPEWRRAIEKRKLTLLSANSPYFHFSVGRAMDRNKYIYAQSRCAIVVESTLEKGGTWTGAMENLRNHWVPFYVRETTRANSGNNALVERGGIRLNAELSSMRSLFDESYPVRIDVKLSNRESIISGDSSKQSGTGLDKFVNMPVAVNDIIANPENFDLYDEVKKRLSTILLKGSRSGKELSLMIGVNATQLNVWLNRALDEGMIVKKDKPAQYTLITRTLSAYQNGFFPANVIYRSFLPDSTSIESIDIYTEVKKHLVYILRNDALTAVAISKYLKVSSPAQVNEWLKKACNEGYLEELTKPKRYRLKKTSQLSFSKK